MELRELILRATDENQLLLDFLLSNGFDQVPASMKHHGACSGGLVAHSIKVMDRLVELTEQLNLKWEKERSPYLIGLLHDICKIDCYIWDEEKQRYVWNKEADSRHGEKSLELLQQFMELTNEEASCIRWHMGAFDHRENWVPYGDAVHQYPNVLWTHTADMLAAKVDQL